MKNVSTRIASSLANELFHNEEEGLLHTPYAHEKALLECVSRGDVEALERTYRSMPDPVYGKMTSSGSLLKLLFYAGISNTTLVTRYAIEGGLDEETAFSLSDVYIRLMELCTSVDELNELNEQMAADFTLRVKAASESAKTYSLAVSRTIEHIYHGRNRDTGLEILAEKVGLTPKYLSALFRKETGENLVFFMQKVRIHESMNLLKYSDYSLSDISSYLNFSSQSYFTTVFKKHTGFTPREYREKNRQISW